MVCHYSVRGGFPQPDTRVLQPSTLPHPAKAMTPPQRRQLALEALAGTETVSRLAGQNAVSRKFVYRQAAKAEEALDAAFSIADCDDEKTLTPRAAICSTSSLPNSACASRLVLIASGRWFVHWRTNATICWPSPLSWIMTSRSWLRSFRFPSKQPAPC